MFYSCEKSFSRKYPVLPIEKFPSLKPSTHTLLLNFRSITCQVYTCKRLKTKENFTFLTLKVVVVANKRWLLTRGSKYSDLS